MSTIPISTSLIAAVRRCLLDYEKVLVPMLKDAGNTDAGDGLSHELNCVRITLRGLQEVVDRYDDSQEDPR